MGDPDRPNWVQCHNIAAEPKQTLTGLVPEAGGSPGDVWYCITNSVHDAKSAAHAHARLAGGIHACRSKCISRMCSKQYTALRTASMSPVHGATELTVCSCISLMPGALSG